MASRRHVSAWLAETVVDCKGHLTDRGRPARAARRSSLDSVEKVLTTELALPAELTYREDMDLSTWAEDHAGTLLSPLGRRWDHAQAVGDTARQLGSGLTAEEADVLVAAAYLHDIGYAPALAISGFHPLDGGRHLRRLGHERLATLVAHHTRARHEAHIRGLTSELAEFDPEHTPVSAALAYCDLTTGPNGEDMTPEQRLVDVEARYGSNDPVTRGMRAAWPELMSDVEQVEGLLDKATTTVSQPR